MDQTTKHTLNRQLRQPVYAILAAALVLLLCVFLPYGTATGNGATGSTRTRIPSWKSP